MFANAMGNDCTFCHASEAVFDKAKFADSTPRIMKARQMIVMMNAINKQYFAGQTRVTCFTCHGGSDRPRSEPDLALQYAEPVFDPNAREIPPDPRMTADQVFDKYIQALGGADRLAKLTSYVAKGSYSGFDTSFDKIPVEIYAAAPNQMTMVTHLSTGHQHQGVQRPQRLDGRPRHAAAAGDADGRQSRPRAARGDRGVSRRRSGRHSANGGLASP